MGIAISFRRKIIRRYIVRPSHAPARSRPCRRAVPGWQYASLRSLARHHANAARRAQSTPRRRAGSPAPARPRAAPARSPRSRNARRVNPNPIKKRVSVSTRRASPAPTCPAAVSSGTLTVLAGSDLHAHNSFEQPNEVTPQEKEVRATGKIVEIQIPAASVTKLTLTLV